MRRQRRMFVDSGFEEAVRRRDEAAAAFDMADPRDPLAQEAACLRLAAEEVHLRSVLDRFRRKGAAS